MQFFILENIIYSRSQHVHDMFMTCPFCRRPFALHPFLRQPLAAHDSLTLAQRAAADGGATGAQHASGAWAVWF